MSYFSDHRRERDGVILRADRALNVLVVVLAAGCVLASWTIGNVGLLSRAAYVTVTVTTPST